MEWSVFEHEADVGVRGIGQSLADAFAGAATALTAVVCDPGVVAAREAVKIECRAPDAELLLVDWLNALVFEMASRHMLFSRFELRVDGSALQASAWGEPLDVARHHPATEVKGVSYCELKVARRADGNWLAQCVVDV